jgi:xylan 1,4-beta-xylosidase
VTEGINVVVHARVTVDAGEPVGTLERIWAAFGYDEISWTATPRGRRNMAALREIVGGPAVVRAHNLLTSGNGRGLPHWSSGNVYHEDAFGRPRYDWSQADAAFDVWLENGMRPLVELGFCPIALTRAPDRPFVPMPSLYGPYESWGWSSPPNDDRRWADLIEAVVTHFAERYGEAEVGRWYWEFWNEPDIGYWQGTVEEYCHFYDVTVAAVRHALPAAFVGGPATTGEGTAFLRAFLDHCTSGTNGVTGERGTPLDFASFHTKGAAGFGRTYGPIGPDGASGAEKASPSTKKMLDEIGANLAVVRSYPSLADVPVLVDECDPGVPAHLGIFDNRNYAFRNTEYYAVFQLQLMTALLNERDTVQRGVSLATAWAWYMEGDRYFEGTRSFFTASDIATPVTNAYRMLAMLGRGRLAAHSEQAVDGDCGGATIGALATVDDDGNVAVIVWNHNDDQYARGACRVDLTVRRLGCAGRPVRIREYRIDSEHSNSHTAWVRLGRPQCPTPEQVAAIRASESLEMVSEETMRSCPDTISRELTLPCPGAALVWVCPGYGRGAASGR